MQTPAPGVTYVTAAPRQETGFLEESPGNSSAMRLMCMMALVTAIILSVFVIATPPKPYEIKDAEGRITSVNYPPRDPQAIYLIFGFLVAAFAPKAIQKFAEKVPNYDPKLYLGQTAGTVLGMLPAAGGSIAAPVAAAAAPMPLVSVPLQTQPAPQPSPLAAADPGSALQEPDPQPQVPGITRLQSLQNRGAL